MPLRARVLAPDLARKDHDMAHGIMARLWWVHNDLYCMYGMWYFGELTKLCAYGFIFKVSGTFGSKGKGPV